MTTCKRGHIEPRRDSRGTCMQCQAERNRRPDVRAQQRASRKARPRLGYAVVAAVVSARLMERSVLITETGCRIWLGAEYREGYGQIEHGGHRYATHRVAFASRFGDVSADRLVCHKCDTPQCINPDHLFLGTTQDNARDRASKGRTANQHHRAA